MNRLIPFQEAIKLADENKHLLIGNGFSIDWRKDIFRYDALFNRADFSSLAVSAQDLFNALGTNDFEVVIEALRKASQLAKLYEIANTSLAQKFTDDASRLKDIGSCIVTVRDVVPWPHD
jgi:hypothetical protein